MDALATKLKRTMKMTRTSPRVIQGVTGIHYTTIYNILNKGRLIRPHKINQIMLNRAIDVLADMKEKGVMPLPRSATVKDKIEAIKLHKDNP